VIAYRYSTIIYWTKFLWVSNFLKKAIFTFRTTFSLCFCYEISATALAGEFCVARGINLCAWQKNEVIDCEFPPCISLLSGLADPNFHSFERNFRLRAGYSWTGLARESRGINTLVLIPRHACLGVRFGFKKKIGSLSETIFPVIFISLIGRQLQSFLLFSSARLTQSWKRRIYIFIFIFISSMLRYIEHSTHIWF
jgi:hypothetical protein